MEIHWEPMITTSLRLWYGFSMGRSEAVARAHCIQAFSAALVITIIVGASIGGFGTLYENMSEATAVIFLKVFLPP